MKAVPETLQWSICGTRIWWLLLGVTACDTDDAENTVGGAVSSTGSDGNGDEGGSWSGTPDAGDCHPVAFGCAAEFSPGDGEACEEAGGRCGSIGRGVGDDHAVVDCFEIACDSAADCPARFTGLACGDLAVDCVRPADTWGATYPKMCLTVGCDADTACPVGMQCSHGPGLAICGFVYSEDPRRGDPSNAVAAPASGRSRSAASESGTGADLKRTRE